MKRKKDSFIPCVIQQDATGGKACDGAGHVHSGSAELVIAQSIRKLRASELTGEEFTELGFGQVAGNALGEAGQAVSHEENCTSTTPWMLDATIRVVSEQISNLDLETEMLGLRKRALKRRLRMLKRLVGSLQPHDDDATSA